MVNINGNILLVDTASAEYVFKKLLMSCEGLSKVFVVIVVPIIEFNFCCNVFNLAVKLDERTESELLRV